MPAPPRVAPGAPMEEHLAVAREELIARLGAEIKPERRKLLSRVMTALTTGAAALAIIALVLILGYIAVTGVKELSFSFLINDPKPVRRYLQQYAPEANSSFGCPVSGF